MTGQISNNQENKYYAGRFIGITSSWVGCSDQVIYHWSEELYLKILFIYLLFKCSAIYSHEAHGQFDYLDRISGLRGRINLHNTLGTHISSSSDTGGKMNGFSNE